MAAGRAHRVKHKVTAATITATEPFRHLVLYVPPGESFFAVEPVSNANDGFNLFARGIAGSGVRVLVLKSLEVARRNAAA